MRHSSVVSLLILLVGISWFILFLLEQDQFIRAQGELTNENRVIYENKVSGLSVPYPSDWSVNETNLLHDGTGYVEFLPSNGSSSVRIGSTYEEFSPEHLAKITAQEIAKKHLRIFD